MAGPAWKTVDCAGCHRPIASGHLFLVAYLRRTLDDGIEIVSPGLAHCCSLPCLATWARGQAGG